MSQAKSRSRSRRSGLKPGYWQNKPLDQMNEREWEALCDGCGKCCLQKLEDQGTGEITLTRVACRLLDDATCRCSRYSERRDLVPDCIKLSPESLPDHFHWLPETCAYRVLHEGRDLPDWHPLVSGDPDSVHRAGASVCGITVSESDISEEDWESYPFDNPG